MSSAFLPALCVGLWAAGPPPPDGPPSAAVRAVTAPSEDLTLAFTRPGQVAAVLVREGQRIAAGDLLVRLDDAVERVQVALLKAQADNTAAVQAAELHVARSRDVLHRVQKAHDEKAAPQRELEEAKVSFALAELNLQIARLQREQDLGKLRKAEMELERMRLVSPVEATVERLRVRAGEAVDALAPVVRLVRVDPLWVDVPAPIRQARRLRGGQEALVRFPEGDQPARGRIVRVSRVADAASETLEVRVELPNPDGRPAGEQVTVEFPEAASTRPADGPAAR